MRVIHKCEYNNVDVKEVKMEGTWISLSVSYGEPIELSYPWSQPLVLSHINDKEKVSGHYLGKFSCDVVPIWLDFCVGMHLLHSHDVRYVTNGLFLCNQCTIGSHILYMVPLPPLMALSTQIWCKWPLLITFVS